MCMCQLELSAIAATVTNILIKVIMLKITNSVRDLYSSTLVHIVCCPKSRTKPMQFDVRSEVRRTSTRKQMMHRCYSMYKKTGKKMMQQLRSALLKNLIAQHTQAGVRE